MVSRHGFRKTILAYALWAAACAVGCDRERIYSSREADSSIAVLYSRSVIARAERMNCLRAVGDTIKSTEPAGWQVVSPRGDGVITLEGMCGSDGTIHAHVLPDSSGGIDSMFSEGDRSQHKQGRIYCVVYSTQYMRCKNDHWEGKVKYGER